MPDSLGNQVVLIEAAFLHQPQNAANDAIEQLAADYGTSIEDDGGFILHVPNDRVVAVSQRILAAGPVAPQNSLPAVIEDAGPKASRHFV